MGGGKRGEGVTNEVVGMNKRNEVEIERWGEQLVWRSVSVLSRHHCMNWKTHAYTHTHTYTQLSRVHTHIYTLVQSSRMTVPLAIISSSINFIVTDPPVHTSVTAYADVAPTCMKHG